MVPTDEGVKKGVDVQRAPAIVVSHGSDFVSVIVKYSSGTPADKIELFTLYPKLERGFLTSAEAFMGSDLMWKLSTEKESVPEASARVVPMKCKRSE